MPTVEEIRKALEVVIDPELHRSIVELDMIRRIVPGPDGDVAVTVSLTTAGCPIRGHFQSSVRDAVMGLDGGSAATTCRRARSRSSRTSSAWDPARAASASRR